MARLVVKGPYEGPGEKKTAMRLAAELPDSWVVFAGRKLPGADRDDSDLIVVGSNVMFVLEEKSWGPRLVVGDGVWEVNGEPRPNPLNRVASVARKLRGHLNLRVKAIRNNRGHVVLQAVVLSHDRVQVFAAQGHSHDELILPLAGAAAALKALDAGAEASIGAARQAAISILEDLPDQGSRPERIGPYVVAAEDYDLKGVEKVFWAKDSAGSDVVLKCYKTESFSQHGDPHEFLARETKAINELADLSRTWRALPYFEDDARGLFVVPLVPTKERRNLLESVVAEDPARPGGRVEETTAAQVLVDAFTALAEVHSLGLTHRALHPSRVWLGRSLRVMFSDFHLARLPTDRTISAWAPEVELSDDYRAPECSSDIRLATPESDVFSLSLCLAYWLLGEDVSELSHAQVMERLDADWSWAMPLKQGLSGQLQDRPPAERMVKTLRQAWEDQQRATGQSRTVGRQPEPDEFEVGGTIDGRFEIETSLGQGGFATTWVAYDKRTDSRRVLKQFHREIPEEAKREFRQAQSIRNDRCGRVFDMQVEKAPYWIAFEYFSGSNLAEFAVNGAAEVEVYRQVSLDVLEGLEYLHSHGFVHGDVTPFNVIVSDQDNRATLIDFGLSVALGDTPVGHNPRFASPEVMAGHPVNPTSDLFGFASSVIFAMLGRDALQRLPGGGTRPDVNPPTAAERELWGADGSALLDALFRGVEPQPDRRPTSASEFAELVRSARVIVGRGQKRAINPAVVAIRRLYRASGSGNAGNRGLDDEFAKQTYVPTRLDEELLPRVLSGDLSVVLLTGNPGDGKTSFLAMLGEELTRDGAQTMEADEAGWVMRRAGHEFHAVFDASESHGDLSSDDLVKRALRPVVDGGGADGTALIAVNDGRLLQFFTDHEDEYEDLALEVRRQVLGQAPSDPRVAVVDLKRRSLAAFPEQAGLAGLALEALVANGHWVECQTCRARDACPILANRNLLAGKGADAFGELVLTSHLRRTRRATFRDVRSAAAWLITGDKDCSQVHELMDEGRDPARATSAAAYDLAFDPASSDYLVREWVDIDPGEVAVPMVDSERRRATAADRSGLGYGSIKSVSRALFFGDWEMGTDRGQVRAYRYLEEFVEMLRSPGHAETRDRLLLGISRLVGAFGYDGPGLAMRSGSPDSEWVVLRLVPEIQFSVSAPIVGAYVETIPDVLTLRHEAGPGMELGLDTVEIILRAADGEIVDDLASDSVKQEVEAFVNQLSRQPSVSVRIVDASGSFAVATQANGIITMELK